MAELYEHAFAWVNAPYTVLLIVIVVYWLLVIIGMADLDLFDFDVDVDADPGLDVDGAELDGGVTGHDGAMSVLGFLNIGEVPIMLYVSLIVLEMWIISLEVTEWFGTDKAWIGWVLVIPNFVFCLLFTKFLLDPWKWYRSRSYPRSTLVGKTCVVTSMEVTEKFGRCEVATDSSPILVNARTENGEVLRKGDAAVVLKHIPEDNFHVVTKQTWE